jgi:hypothetical protein
VAPILDAIYQHTQRLGESIASTDIQLIRNIWHIIEQHTFPPEIFLRLFDSDTRARHGDLLDELLMLGEDVDDVVLRFGVVE